MMLVSDVDIDWHHITYMRRPKALLATRMLQVRAEVSAYHLLALLLVQPHSLIFGTTHYDVSMVLGAHVFHSRCIIWKQ